MVLGSKGFQCSRDLFVFVLGIYQSTLFKSDTPGCMYLSIWKSRQQLKNSFLELIVNLYCHVVFMVNKSLNKIVFRIHGIVFRWCFQIFLCPSLFGEDFQFDEHIVQRGWNHQLGVMLYLNYIPKASHIQSYHKPNKKVVFQPPFFRVYVKLRGGKYKCMYINHISSCSMQGILTQPFPLLFMTTCFHQIIGK